MKKIVVCVGTRPNFIKITRLKKLFESAGFQYTLLHTGQHFDHKMSKVFFEELDIDQPDVSLGIREKNALFTITRIMEEAYTFFESHKPDLVMVPGDVNSTFACAFAANRLGIPVAHIESGLRSFDRSMPEEINRILTDNITDLFFTSEPSGKDNLLKENKPEESIAFVGNTMIDTLAHNLPKIDASTIQTELGIDQTPYYLVTFHRPSNVDAKKSLTRVCELVNALAEMQHVVFPIHPRTENRLKEHGLLQEIEKPSISFTPPLGYLDFLNLVKNATAVVTDSGGIQEETTYLQVPCITVRDNTERPVTVIEGTNELIGMHLDKIVELAQAAQNNTFKKGKVPQNWDGHASERIVAAVETFFKP